MAGGWELSGKPFGTGMVMVMVIVVLVLLTCLSGVQAEEVALEKDEVVGGSAKDNWGPKLRASLNFGSKAYGGYTRLRSPSCSIQPSACLNAKVPGSACCGAACLDLDSHPGHCGRCNHACQPGRVCCYGKCKNLNRDKNNCGSCQMKCGKGSGCSFGLCGY